MLPRSSPGLPMRPLEPSEEVVFSLPFVSSFLFENSDLCALGSERGGSIAALGPSEEAVFTLHVVSCFVLETRTYGH